MISESESCQRQLGDGTAVPNGDELRRIAISARTSASDDASPIEYVLAGWKAAMLAASTVPQQKPVGEVQHLHELNDSWLNKLPIGTKLYTAPQPASVSSDTLYLLRRLLSNQHTLTGPEFRAELEKIVGEAYQQGIQEPYGYVFAEQYAPIVGSELKTTREVFTRVKPDRQCLALYAAPQQVAQKPVAIVVECGNLYAKVKLSGEAFGTTKVGDRLYKAQQP